MELKILSDAEDEICRVVVEGNVTTRDFESGGPDPLEELLGPDWSAKKLVVDLRAVQFMDSTGIGWLVSTNRRAKENHGAMVFHSIHPTVSQMLQLLKMGSILSLVDSEQAALDLLGS